MAPYCKELGPQRANQAEILRTCQAEESKGVVPGVVHVKHVPFACTEDEFRAFMEGREIHGIDIANSAFHSRFDLRTGCQDNDPYFISQ